MTTGDGGMMVSNDPELFKDVKAMRWVGIDKDNWKSAQSYTEVNRDSMHWYYELNILGYKYNMNDLAASIGLIQLDKLDEMNNRRCNVIKSYINGINNQFVNPILPYEPEKYVYWMFAIKVENKEESIIYLKSKGIATGCHYTPLTLQPLFKKYKSACPIAEKEYFKMITLPLHSDLTKKEINYIISFLNKL